MTNDKALSQNVKLDCALETWGWPASFNTHQYRHLELWRSWGVRLGSSLKQLFGKRQEHLPTFAFRCRTVLPCRCRFSLLSKCTPSRVEQQSQERRASEDWRNLCRCAPKTRPGELTALWQPTPVAREGKRRHFWRDSANLPAVCGCHLFCVQLPWGHAIVTAR